MDIRPPHNNEKVENVLAHWLILLHLCIETTFRKEEKNLRHLLPIAMGLLILASFLLRRPTCFSRYGTYNIERFLLNVILSPECGIIQ